MVRRDTKNIDLGRLIRWFNIQAPFYHLWRDRYDGKLVRTVAAQVEGLRPRTILDAACGSGLFMVGLARRFVASRVVGVDLSSGMLSVSRSQCRRRRLANTSLLRGNVERLPFQARTFGAVVAGGILATADPDLILAELVRVLERDGCLMLVEFDRETMTPTGRGFLSAMVLAFRAVSRLIPAVRFADGWSVDASLVDWNLVRERLRRMDVTVDREIVVSGHRILCCSRGNAHAQP